MPVHIDALTEPDRGAGCLHDGDPDLDQPGAVLAAVKHKPAAPVAAMRPCLTTAARDACATFRPGEKTARPAEQENGDA